MTRRGADVVGSFHRLRKCLYKNNRTLWSSRYWTKSFRNTHTLFKQESFISSENNIRVLPNWHVSYIRHEVRTLKWLEWNRIARNDRGKFFITSRYLRRAEGRPVVSYFLPGETLITPKWRIYDCAFCGDGTPLDPFPVGRPLWSPAPEWTSLTALIRIEIPRW